MASIPKKTEKRIYQEANSCCAICTEDNVEALEMHHMLPKANGGDDSEDNLLLVCSSCHSKIHGGTISVSEVYVAKHNLKEKKKNRQQVENKGQKPEVPLPLNIADISVDTNHGMVAQTINYKNNSKSAPKFNPPIGTIASDFEKRNYIKHLIDRYNEFKKSDKSVGNFKYAIIYNAIKKEFKAKWDMIPLGVFPELVIYLHKRIDNTRVGRVRKSRGQKSYSTFEEYLKDLHKN